jgi:hypothetical protein
VERTIAALTFVTALLIAADSVRYSGGYQSVYDLKPYVINVVVWALSVSLWILVKVVARFLPLWKQKIQRFL